MTGIEIHELSQEAAEAFRRAQPGETLVGFRKAFDEEETNLERCGVWALSAAKRRYYLISLRGTHYLLIGVNPNITPRSINLSSVVRVASEPRGKAHVCLGKLVEDKLVPMCKEMGKDTITARANTDRGRKMLERFWQNLPLCFAQVQLGSADSYYFLLRPNNDP